MIQLSQDLPSASDVAEASVDFRARLSRGVVDHGGLAAQVDLVEIVHTLRQVVCVKG